MKYSFIDILAGIISAIIASMGLGGGGEIGRAHV